MPSSDARLPLSLTAGTQRRYWLGGSLPIDDCEEVGSVAMFGLPPGCGCALSEDEAFLQTMRMTDMLKMLRTSGEKDIVSAATALLRQHVKVRRATHDGAKRTAENTGAKRPCSSCPVICDFR